MLVLCKSALKERLMKAFSRRGLFYVRQLGEEIGCKIIPHNLKVERKEQYSRYL